jgi:hypothetical protein
MLEISSSRSREGFPAIACAPGLNVVEAWDSFLRCCHLDLLCLVAKLFHVGGDVEGLRCHVYRPTNGS